jgi:predicted CXXCH cytochrome family protein
MRLKLQALFALALLSCAVGQETPSHAAPNVAITKHNLSVSGPGTIKSATEPGVCIFCHTPHNASSVAPLWNRRDPSAVYVPYTSNTAKGAMGQPNGSSLLCLSCHDGTIALGELLSRPGVITAVSGTTANMMPAGPGLLGTDLSDDHPVSFAYNTALINLRGGVTAGELADPATLPTTVKLDSTGRMQCSTCHDPHDNTFGKFLVMSNTNSALCTTCHTKSTWLGSSHQTSTKTWSGVAPNPWPTTSTTATTVAANACENCHQPHSAPGKKNLVHNATEEGTCYNCHNATFNATTKNIQSEMAKVSAHNVASTTGTHDPTEPTLITTRHVECADCHNPHATVAAGLGQLGTMSGVRGININGVAVTTASREEEVCFRCHSDNANLPAAKSVRRLASNSGATTGVNTRLQFQTTNVSYHPVAGIGKSTNVPSLKTGWTTASTIKCSDCHDNNAGPGGLTVGTGPKGPHGSTNPSILVGTFPTSGAITNTVCSKCHNTPGGFTAKSHHSSVTGCRTCHDPHGVIGGTMANNQRLFNPLAVATTGQAITLVADFTNRTCSGSCHGTNHSNWAFGG